MAVLLSSTNQISGNMLALCSIICISTVHSVVLKTRENLTYKQTDIPSPVPTSTQTRWADAAFKFIANISCAHTFFTTPRQCERLLQRKRSDVSVYLAGPSAYGRLRTVVPDGGLSKAGAHDGVVVIDPYPMANFGHLVVVLFVDIGKNRRACLKEGGHYLGYGECLTLASKRRCKNAIESRRRRRNFARRCEINFLPLVYVEKDPRRRQLLACKDALSGFAPCPTLRPQNETSGWICNPIHDNSKRCETSQFAVKTSCRVFEICDQAVLISGGWNKHGSFQRHKQNVVDFYQMLRKNGFIRRNIKLFFANGMRGIDVDKEKAHTVFPAALKSAMRAHIQKLCQTPHCVDSLVLYMNSPSKMDGTSLLWDANGNGLAESSEKYSISELMKDVQNCQARQVKIVVDQSYAGEIARAFKRNKPHKHSNKHKNVAIYASSRDNEFSWKSEYTQHWTKYLHTHTCTKQVHEASRINVKHSTPYTTKGSRVNQSTIFGAPCDVVPPFTKKELNQNYWGCQNLPTALWLRHVSYAKRTSHSRKYPFGS